MATTIDDLTVIVVIENVSSIEGMTASGMNTEDAYTGLIGMDTAFPFMPRRRLSMRHRHRRRESVFFYPPSSFAEGSSMLTVKQSSPRSRRPLHNTEYL